MEERKYKNHNYEFIFDSQEIRELLPFFIVHA